MSQPALLTGPQLTKGKPLLPPTTCGKLHASSSYSPLFLLCLDNDMLAFIVKELGASGAFAVKLSCRSLRLCVHSMYGKYTKTNMKCVVQNQFILEWALAVGCPRTRVTGFAAIGGHLATLRWALYHKFHWDEYTSQLVAGAGQLQVLQWLDANKYDVDFPMCCTAAAGGGHLGVIQWLHSFCDFDYDVAQCAARGGHIHILEWLIDQGTGEVREDICDSAAEDGKLEVVKWLQTKNFDCCSATTNAAAHGGQLDMLKWLHFENHCELGDYICDQAVLGGHLEVLRWLITQGASCNNRTTDIAAEFGYLDILKWLIQEGWHVDDTICGDVASDGHFAMLKWLVAEGYRCDRWTAARAAGGGDLDILKWLRAQGCPWDHLTLDMAIHKGHMDVFRWAVANGCPTAL